MSTRANTRFPRLTRLVLSAAVLAAALLFAAPGGATPGAVPAPSIPGVAPLPGPVAPATTPASTMGLLKVSPDQGNAGTPVTISGQGLPADKDVAIHWATANATWQLDARADSVDYLGRNTDKLNVVRA
jgi:hypothetical protein